jgi:uncharacterized protein (DUF952 family)
MEIIYHIAFVKDWETAKQHGYYFHPSLNDEGFIHCSLEHQVSGVLDRYFRGKDGLIKLVIDPAKLKSRFVYDWSPSTGDSFPHVYGPINTDAVIDEIIL